MLLTKNFPEMSAVAEKQNTLLSRLEETLRGFPSHIAVTGKSGTLTYAELDHLSARCAGALQNKSDNRFGPIALLMKHDVPLIAAIVGVLRSGGFYLVLNRALPPARLGEALKQIRPAAIVTDTA